MLSIVMYHYVRDLAQSKFPRIKGLDRAEFIGQLSYLARHYVPVSMEQIIAAWCGKEVLPERSVHLTFDDGLIDHYEVGFSLIQKYGWKASFFPIAEMSVDNKVADVHKIHHVLASIENSQQLYLEMLAWLDDAREEWDLDATAEYQKKYVIMNRVGDEPEVNFIKRMLQKGLPALARKALVNDLFCRHVTTDEESFSHEIYMKPGHLKEMMAEGMHIGSHGWSHNWLAEIERGEAKTEILQSRDFLVSLGVKETGWTISYPYGSLNDDVISIARDAGAVLGLTSRFDVADPAKDEAFLVPRLDTNLVPKNSQADLLEWRP